MAIAIFDLHTKFSTDEAAYIAICDAMAAAKVLTRKQWRETVARGKQLSEQIASARSFESTTTKEKTMKAFLLSAWLLASGAVSAATITTNADFGAPPASGDCSQVLSQDGVPTTGSINTEPSSGWVCPNRYAAEVSIELPRNPAYPGNVFIAYNCPTTVVSDTVPVNEAGAGSIVLSVTCTVQNQYTPGTWTGYLVYYYVTRYIDVCGVRRCSYQWVTVAGGGSLTLNTP